MDNNIFMLVPEIFYQIMDYLEFHSQITLLITCKNNFNITNFDVPFYLSRQITLQKLKQNPHINKLNLYDNVNVNDISFLKNITYLNISGSCSISQDHISHLTNLRILDISNNVKVNKLDMFQKLETLKINGICNIGIYEMGLLPNLKTISKMYNPDF